MTSRSAIVLLWLLAANAQAPQTATEFQIKAAFLFNFTKFVEWPAGSFKSPSDGISICVLGDSLVGAALIEVIASKRINDRPLTAVRLADVKDAGKCQILFISSSERKNLRAILAAVGSAGILIVGESENFALEGGTIGFRLDEGRVRLEINLKAAERSQIQISSKLLSLAQIVKK